LDRLNGIRQRFDEVNDLIIQPDIISDPDRYVRLHREYKELKPLTEVRDIYMTLIGRIEEAEQMLRESNDKEMRELAEIEREESSAALEKLEEKIKWMLI